MQINISLEQMGMVPVKEGFTCIGTVAFPSGNCS